MTDLRLEQVKKSYGDTEVIHGVDLDIKSGEFIVLVGPSGCGKSTLLRLIAGLEKVTSGTIYIDDEKVNQVSAADRGLAMVFQSYALYPHMSVYKNMAFGLENTKMPRNEIEARVMRAAEMLQITDYLKRKPKALSGGQRQRVAIGRAIVRDPKAFLFDEPLSNLDAELRVTMRKELAALHDQIEGTMIYVTHDQVEAMTLADRIVVLNGGNVEQIGTPLELYNTPNNTFVAGFIGSPKMNMFSAEVEATTGATMKVRYGRNTITLPNDGNCQPGDQLTLGARPEHIDIVDNNTAGQADGEINVMVDIAEQLGGETYFYCSAEGLPQFTIHQLGQKLLQKGQTLKLRLRHDYVHVFDNKGHVLHLRRH